MEAGAKRIILGSSSPRRSQIMTAGGAQFLVMKPDIDETPFPDEPPVDYVARLSREKALAILSMLDGDTSTVDAPALILTADTTVADGSEILGKPDDADHAKRMLQQLGGRTHVVHTGVSLVETGTVEVQTIVVTTQVTMRSYGDLEIAAYIASGDPFGKAGSYAIQNVEFHPVDRLDGCYLSVVGLPLCAVCTLLGKHGVTLLNTPTCTPEKMPCNYAGL